MKTCPIVGSVLAAASFLGLSFALTRVSAQELPKAPELTDANFAKWHGFIRPKPEEIRWAEIPWLTSFWDGVQEAQAKDRPMLFWTMDGHPLACT